jgi:hypothetical protein
MAYFGIRPVLAPPSGSLSPPPVEKETAN